MFPREKKNTPFSANKTHNVHTQAREPTHTTCRVKTFKKKYYTRRHMHAHTLLTLPLARCLSSWFTNNSQHTSYSLFNRIVWSIMNLLCRLINKSTEITSGQTNELDHSSQWHKSDSWVWEYDIWYVLPESSWVFQHSVYEQVGYRCLFVCSSSQTVCLLFCIITHLLTQNSYFTSLGLPKCHFSRLNGWKDYNDFKIKTRKQLSKWKTPGLKRKQEIGAE